MCTNFTPTTRAQWVKENLGVDLLSGCPEEAYPGYLAPVVVKSRQSERVACGLARFGLIPGWAKDDKISRHTYNARSETAAEKPQLPDRMAAATVWTGAARQLLRAQLRVWQGCALED